MFRKYVPRDDEYFVRLKDVISKEYKLNIVDIKPAKRGYFGETWQLVAPDACYFAKLDHIPRHQNIFKNSLPVVDYLCNSGIDFINKVIRTQSGELCAAFDSAILGIFEWIDGENIETDETKAPEYLLLCDVFKLTKQGFDIPVIEFSNTAALEFYGKWERLKASPRSTARDKVLWILERHSESLSHFLLRLSHFSQLCQAEAPDFYLTHGDAGGNLLVSNDRFFIVDWDEVMYAPLERDAWVMSCREWAVKLFNDTLEKKGIPYTLRTERLAFFCYHMFFHYLNGFMDDFALHGQAHELEGYFSGSWVWERVGFADGV